MGQKSLKRSTSAVSASSARLKTRPHTGRTRNDGVRRAILTAASELIVIDSPEHVTIEAITARARTSRSTIYRWWRSKEELLLEAVVFGAHDHSRQRPARSVDELLRFVKGTYATAGEPATEALLRAAVAQAIVDGDAAIVLADFLRSRRVALLNHVRTSSADLGGLDVDLFADIVLGVLWYRVLFQLSPLRPDDAEALLHHLLPPPAAPARSGSPSLPT